MKERKNTKEQHEKIIKKQKGITLIALVITIIVLLILAGVSIAMLTGNNGILTQANNSKIKQSHGAVKEAISLAYNEWQIEINTGSTTKLASTETVIINGEEEKSNAGTGETFLQFIESKGYIKEGTTDVLNVEKLTGSKQALGNGETTDVYKIKEQDGNYILSYYDTNNKEEQLWSVPVSTGSSEGNISYNDELKTLKPGDYVIYDTGLPETGEVVCRVLYDANSEYGLQIITDDCIKENGEYVEVTFGTSSDEDAGTDEYDAPGYSSKSRDAYNNAIKTLNDAMIKYINIEYSLDARCVGSNPKDKNSETTEHAIRDEDVGSGKAEDNNYETDYNVLTSLEILNIQKSYWLASRYVDYGRVYLGEGFRYYVRMVGQEEQPIFKEQWNNATFPWDDGGKVTNGLRPVFTLKGDLKIVSGDGKSEATAYRFN